MDFETSISTRDGHAQKAELVLQPELELELPAEWALRASARLRVDAYDVLEPGLPPNAAVSDLSRRYSLGRRGTAELRELYAAGSVGNALLRVGKQHIVWGTADGLKVLDVVNPQDFREFILDEFEDSRIPLWAVQTELPLGPGSLQLVWLPDTTYHVFPERGALYELTSPHLLTPLPENVPIARRDLDRPNDLLRDSDAGARYVGFLAGWDFSLNYLYHYDDAPVIFRRPVGADAASWVIEPEYRRTHLAGLTFSNAFGDLTVRGELGYSFGRYFAREDPLARESHRRLDELAYVIGLDWYGVRETLFSVQLFQSSLTGPSDDLIRERIEWNATLLVRREFLNDRLTAELQWIVSLNRGDGLVRGRVSYELRDGLRVWLAGDVFHGRRSGLFGQFGSRDRISLGLEWSIAR